MPDNRKLQMMDSDRKVASARCIFPLPEPPALRGLYIAATPIGNLRDVTLRLLDVLNSCDLILAEDTRKTAILLEHYGIRNHLKSFRVHRLREDTDFALRSLEEGKSVVFVTDAGTPGISDPVSHLVREARLRLPDLPITPVPGPSALTAALSVCGWQTNPSLFAGFLSPKPGRRRKSLTELAVFSGVIVIYESVHRVERLLAEIQEILPGREILLGREITKMHEEFLHVPAGMPVPEFTLKGEFTVLIGPAGRSNHS